MNGEEENRDGSGDSEIKGDNDEKVVERNRSDDTGKLGTNDDLNGGDEIEEKVTGAVDPGRNDQNNGEPVEKVLQKGMIWDYELSRGKWIRYEEAINNKLTESVAEDVVEFELDETKVRVDLNTMQQRNMDTGFVRSIRCAFLNDEGGYRVWQYNGSKRRWQSLDPVSATKLEAAYRDGSTDVEVLLSGSNFTADLENSIIRSEDGKTEYKIGHVLLTDKVQAEIVVHIHTLAQVGATVNHFETGAIYSIRTQITKAEPSVSARPVPRAARTRALKRIAAECVPDVEQKRKRSSNVGKEGDKEMGVVGDDDESKKDGKSKKEEKPTKEGRGRKKGKSEGQKAAGADGTADGDTSGTTGGTESQMKKVVLKGVAAVDQECHELLDTAHVYTEFEDIYDALLNQTNTQNNNNKYFIIQLLESDTEKRYWAWFRWGRVGYKGQTSLIPCGNDLAKAKGLFCNKFKDKTRNNWTERANFEKVAGKYDYLPADYSKVIEEQKKNENFGEEKEKLPVKSKLGSHLQHLLKLICDVRAMEETMMELEYDATKAPLGKVTEDQIKAGYAALKEIEEHIKNKDFSSGFVEAVNNYYTKIPHFFGMRQPPLIKTIDQLKQEIQLLEALSEIGVAVQTFKKEGEVNVHPIDRHYMNMKCEVSIVDVEDPQYKVVDSYLQWTHAPTHNMYRMRIHNLYAVNREGERERFMSDLGNRKLLWHGSRLTNWYGILSQGLRIAPPEAPVTGYMFGKGIYFADMATKSANYCYPQPVKPGLLVLAQVALGEMRELLDADYNADKLPAGKHSTKGLGSIGPDPSTFITLEDGCEVPCGKPVTLSTDDKHCALNYNEYIVYNVKQVWIRYLVEVDFIFD